ncbi:class I SAM-dependent methyltransferase [Thermospira aquatica]|uniref:Methyltransferase domain-containing protein n=1 Tax=Thermospira aquatica TaxID=2828656 RepID=A0AAX3BEZ0_9SPIR|nr:class I SAM-dependent methyltransferase [Thermospira aquatica]URA10912.1 methyltransferase domain-containing protein [Thermospira aquatica]
MKKQILEEFNSERYDDDHSMDIHSSNNYLRYHLIYKHIKEYVEKNKRDVEVKLLDVGCGPGHLATFLSPLKNLTLYGCDISEKSLALAKEKGMNTVKCNLWETLPFPDGFFDIVVATEVIEHIYDTEHFIREIKRILKEDGLLVITTPNVASLGRRIMLLLGINPVLEYKLSGGAGHIRYFTFKDLRSFLIENGFRIVKMETDAINISFNGKIYSRFLGRVFPTLGRCVCCVANKLRD